MVAQEVFDKLVMQHGLAAGSQNLDFNSHSSTQIMIVIVVIIQFKC